MICEKVTCFVCFFLFLGYIITQISILSSVWKNFFSDFPELFFASGERPPSTLKLCSFRALHRDGNIRLQTRGEQLFESGVPFGVAAP